MSLQEGARVRLSVGGRRVEGRYLDRTAGLMRVSAGSAPVSASIAEIDTLWTKRSWWTPVLAGTGIGGVLLLGVGVGSEDEHAFLLAPFAAVLGGAVGAVVAFTRKDYAQRYPR